MKSLKVLFEMFMPEAGFAKGTPPHGVPTQSAPEPWVNSDEVYPNINTVRDEMPAAYKALPSICDPSDLPEEAFLFDEDGNLTVTVGQDEYIWTKMKWVKNGPAKSFQ